MAKSDPEIVEKFRVLCEVPKEKLGDLIAELTKMGLTDIQHELITNVLNYKKPKRFEINSADFLRDYIKDHPTFTRKDVITYFKKHSREESAAKNALHGLAREGVIKMLGEGNYQRADVKALAAPKKAKSKEPKPTKKIARQSGRYEVTNADVLLNGFRSRKRFTNKEAEEMLEKNGRPGNSAGPVLLKLMSLRKVRRLGQGEYSIAKVPIKKKKAMAHLNGSAGDAPKISSREEVTNV